MAIHHDPARQLDYLQQSLSQDKRSIGFLLAAGCPVSIRVPSGTKTEPLIPDVKGLTDLVGEKLASSSIEPTFKKVREHLQTDGLKEPNVETYLSFVRGLKAIAGGGTVRDQHHSPLSVWYHDRHAPGQFNRSATYFVGRRREPARLDGNASDPPDRRSNNCWRCRAPST